ncbi:MAG: hypothetical protein EHM17_05250 [Verrucomicrobiaceae bacterium]|nr:MAG: hypothetical protein EHM17_05250 [Verrucomicrobiaceae bacterium]
MKSTRSVGILCVLAAGLGFAAPEQGLPSWQDGQPPEEAWVAGSELLVGDAAEGEGAETEAVALELEAPTAGDISGAAVPRSEVPEEYWPAYFAERPQAFLVDPQGLLSPVDQRERLDFLNYHAGDSAIDLFVYVFGGDQEIPGEVREEELVERFFAAGRPAAVVHWFMGAPERTVLRLSPALTEKLPLAEQRRALESSVMQALNQTGPARQFEAFLVQMSIRIYWMERMLGGTEPPAGAIAAPARVVKPLEKKSKVMELLQPHLEQARRFALPAVFTAGALLLLVVVSWWLKHRARHRFPDFEVEPRLGGAHAAGVGAVISFASAALPPASQRDQMPDYLRRA